MSASANELDYTPSIFFKSSEDMSEVESDSVDLIITSPPYNVGKNYGAYNDSQSLPDYLNYLDKVWRECWRVLCDGGRLCVNIADTGRHPHVPLHAIFTERLTRLNFTMRGTIIWNKGSSAGTSTAWGSWQSASNPALRDVHEYILVFSKGSLARKCADRKSTISREEFLECTKTIWSFRTVRHKKGNHPAPFPDELVYRLIQLYSFQDDVVLDPFLGSGTTCRVAQRLKRRSIGYEINEGYRPEILAKLVK